MRKTELQYNHKSFLMHASKKGLSAVRLASRRDPEIFSPVSPERTIVRLRDNVLDFAVLSVSFLALCQKLINGRDNREKTNNPYDGP
jgi:hypothetical protein